MKYLEYRNNIRSGDLLAWSHRGFHSFYDLKLQLVRYATRSEYVHVGIAWNFQGRIFVIESVNPTVRIVPLSNLLPCYVIPLKLLWSKETENLAMSYVGKGEYSQVEAIKALLGKNNSKYLQCVEFARILLKSEGLEFDIKDLPTELVLAAQKLGGYMYYLEE